MRFCDRTWAAPGHRAAFWLVVLGVFAGGSPAVRAQSWPGHALNAQHTSLYSNGSQIPQMIRWLTPVDLDPQYSGNELLTHYGSPMITRSNTVLVPVKTGATSGFRIEAHKASTGALIWMMNTDYALPTYNWIPAWGPTLRPLDKSVVFPAAGGTVIVRTFPDSASGTATARGLFRYRQLQLRSRRVQQCHPDLYVDHQRRSRESLLRLPFERGCFAGLP